jgi:hypothetical protein
VYFATAARNQLRKNSNYISELSLILQQQQEISSEKIVIISQN